MRALEFAERFIFVRKCAGCGELIGYEGREDAFCPSCRVSWERAKANGCALCARSMIECDCMPQKLSKAGMPFLKKLVAYRASEADKAQNRVIYFIKRNKNKRVAAFLARQLSEKLGEILSELERDVSETVLIYLPRSIGARAEYGFDQSELICRELSRITGVKMVDAILRTRRRASEQKALNASQRGKNAVGMFVLNKEKLADIEGKTVVLFDDVVTSGSSMAEALKLLRKAKVSEIYGLCIAFSEM